MSSDRDYISMLGQSLGEGANLRDTCPRCRGGSSGEKSLSVSRKDGDLVWVCFRAKCGFKGATGSSGYQPTETLSIPKKAGWDGKTYPISDKAAARIRELWQMDVPDHWWWTTDYGGRVAMSIRSPRYTHRGWLLRSITSQDGAKALTYTDPGEQGLSWYKTTPHSGTILVEDIPSAVRASTYVNAVALLGTGIGMDRAIEIADHAPRPILVALDQDAVALSFRWARKYALLWGDVRVIPLRQDIKNMKEKDIEELLV